MDRERRALELLAEIAGVDVEALAPEQELVADLGMDSPKALRFLVRLEDELDLEVPDEDAARIRTVGDVRAFLRRLA